MATYSVDGQQLTNIADAIREKIDSTDGLTLDAMAEAIAALETGGAFASGTLTFAENTTVKGYVLEHNLGAVPLTFAIWNENLGRASYECKAIVGIRESVEKRCEYMFYYCTSSTAMSEATNGISASLINESTMELRAPLDAAFFLSGELHHWFVAG